MSVVESYYVDSPIGQFTATVSYMDEDGGYSVNFFSPDGNLLSTEVHTGKTFHFMEGYVQNRLKGIEGLNG